MLTTTLSTAGISGSSGCMDSANTTGNTMEVTNTCTVSQSSPNSGYTTTIASQPSPNNTPLIATTTLTTTIASQPSRDNTCLLYTSPSPRD